MKKPVLLLLLFCLKHLIAPAQTPVPEETLHLLCKGPVFTTAETMPQLVHGAAAYADSLTAYLKARQLAIPSGKLTLRIAVLSTGDVQLAGVLDSTITAPGNLIRAVLGVPGQWKPATQNKYLVCCYRKIYLEVEEEKIRVFVPERL